MMNKPFFKFKEIILDTGPLLLYLIGFYNEKELRRFNYSEDEFTPLCMFLRNFKKIFVTPQVLAEVSNLAKNRLKEEKFSEFIKFSISILARLGEEHVDKNEILKREELPMFGITDVSLVRMAERNRLLLTDDGPLFWYCNGKNMPIIHLDRIRFIS
ncbi:MAG TPA: hypothetical protein ENF23_00085 [Methanosarcinales archaeon]|nr:hypothetical protein [Methanosarcinales archaeon]